MPSPEHYRPYVKVTAFDSEETDLLFVVTLWNLSG